MHGDVITDLGLGLFADVDLVIGCLDNREARLWVNRQCWKTGTPWIDAGIQEIQGVVKVFVPPDSACYECAMTERDYQLLNLRYSCPLLRREEIAGGQGADGADDRLDDGGARRSRKRSSCCTACRSRRARRWSINGVGQPVLLDAAAVPRRLPEPRNLSRAGRAAARAGQHGRRAASKRPRPHVDGPLQPGAGPRAGRRGRLPAVRLAGRGHAAADARSGRPRPSARTAASRPGPSSPAPSRKISPLAAQPLSRVGIPPYDIVRVDGAAESGFFLLAARPGEGRDDGAGGSSR